jgi:enamine deaminase RidA (YjgF/YER057c/UK114 family)
MRKTILGPDVGAGLDLFDGVEGVEQLPHSEAVAVDFPEYRRVFISGTAAIDADGSVVAPGEAVEQLRTILATIEEMLALVDGDMRDVVRMKLISEALSEEEYLDVCRVRESFLPEGHDPASTMIESDNVGMEGMRLEVDADAVVPNGEWELEHARHE